MEKKILVEGMKCANCARHVKDVLMNIEAVMWVDVNLADKFVIIETDSDISDESIRLAIDNEKYNVVGIVAI